MKGKTIFSLILMLTSAITILLTNFNPIALIYCTPIFLLRLSLIIFNKQEYQIEKRKDKK